MLTDQYSPGEIKFFTREGDWIRTIGRQGEGPGEFRYAWFLWDLPEGGLTVFDIDLNRSVTFSESLEHVHTQRWDVQPLDIAVVGSGETVVASIRYNPESIGLPLHLINPEGGWVRSFGADPPERHASSHDLMWRTVVRAGPSEVWAAHLTDYRIERWSTSGTMVEAFERDVEWFQNHEDYGVNVSQDGPPNPGLIGLHQDANGLIWVGIHVPDLEWKEAYVPSKSPYGIPEDRVLDLNAYFDTMLEVIDPERGVVVATARIDQSLVKFTDAGHLVTFRLRDGSIPTIELFEVRLLDTQGGEK